MCRFTAYIGKNPLILKSILWDPENSLVQQSKKAKFGPTGVNGDGFGIGWYTPQIDPYPAIYKSVQPAWNDRNLLNLTGKVTSTCFIGHVRAATVSTVDFANCHPFTHRELLFCHNGTIRGFSKIKKRIIQNINDLYLNNVGGQTDSEYFFALFCTFLPRKKGEYSLEELENAFRKALEMVLSFQEKKGISRLNVAITDGKKLLAIRFTSKKEEKSHSLFKKWLNPAGISSGLIVSSEILDNEPKTWSEIPQNHILTVDEELSMSQKSLF